MLVTWGLVALLAAQPAPTQPPVAVRSPYLDAVRRYGPGTEKEAILALLALRLRDPDQVFEELDHRLCAAAGARGCSSKQLVAAGRESATRVTAAWRQLYPRALALHVEALAACDPTSDLEAMRLHLLVLLRMIRRIDELGRVQPDIPAAFADLATTGRHLLLWVLQYLRQADGLDRAVQTFEAADSRDVDLRLARGALEELRTLPEAVAASARTSDLYDAFARDRMLAQEERRCLKIAARVYEELLVEHPALIEARLRLAHLLLRLGDPAEAVTHLARVADLAPDARQGYLAALFQADVHERHGRPDAAIAAYRMAERNWPGAQAPAVGLARLHTLAGRHAEARAALSALDLARPADAPDPSDPWLGYIGAQAWRLPRAILALQATFDPTP
jgi:tetratricopeptide (TPR) repeat protein